MSLLTLALSVALADPGPQTPIAQRAWDAPPVLVDDPFGWEIVPQSLVAGERGAIEILLTVPEGGKIYRDRVSVRVLSDGGLKTGDAVFPAPTSLDSEWPAYEGDLRVILPARADRPGLAPLQIEVAHQGCREGVCFPPWTGTIETTVRVLAEDR